MYWRQLPRIRFLRTHVRAAEAGGGPAVTGLEAWSARLCRGSLRAGTSFRVFVRACCRFGLKFGFCAVVAYLTVFPVGARPQQTVDQILTLVNDEIITRTDLLWSIAIDSKAPSPAGPVGSDLLRQKLDVMIDERLIAQEASRVPTTEITQDEIEKKRTELIRGFPSEASFRERAGSVGLTPPKIDDLIRQRILIDRFVDFRFRSFVLVTEQEIKRYYDEILVPQIRAAGQVAPPLEEPKVREGISANLKQEKINAEIDKWLTSARQRADVVQLAEP